MPSEFEADLANLLSHTNSSIAASSGLAAAIDAQITRRLQTAKLSGRVVLTALDPHLKGFDDSEVVTFEADIEDGGIS